MEFLKSCTTGVYSVTGYSTILYRIYTTEKSPGAPEGDGGTKLSKTVVLETVQSRLQREGLLVAVHRECGALWTFQNKWKGAPITQLPESNGDPEVEGFDLRRVAQGLFKPNEITRARIRAAAEAKSPLGPPPSPSTAILRTIIANEKAFRANTQGSGTSGSPASSSVELGPLSIYPWFISAVEGLVAFHFASKFSLIPLNGRTFVFPQTSGAFYHSPANERNEIYESIELLSVGTYLTTAGVLVISLSTSRRHDIQQLEDGDYGVSEGPIVRVAPCGTLAKCIGRPNTNHGEARSHSQKKLRPTPGVFSSKEWSKAVEAWLARRGVELEGLDSPLAWLQIQISRDSFSMRNEARDDTADPVIVCLWPRYLLFSVSPNPVDQVEESGLQWFATDSNDEGDSLAQVQKWYASERERERARQARKQAQASTQEQLNVHDLNPPFPASPFYSRADLQTAIGVYPTPPDAILIQPSTLVSAPDVPSVPIATEGPRVNEESAGTGLMPAVKGEAEMMGDIEASPMEGENYLFGDIDMDDDDNFGGNELSEADFNFFDRPDDEADMLEPENPSTGSNALHGEPLSITQQPINPPAHPETISQNQSLKQDFDVRVEEPSEAEDLMPKSPEVAAFDDSRAAVVGLNNPKPTNHVDETILTPGSPAGANVSMSRKKLIFGDGTSNEDYTGSTGLSRWRSLYDNVGLSQKLDGTDTKYSTGGIFNFGPEERRKPQRVRPSLSSVKPAFFRPQPAEHPSKFLERVGPKAISQQLQTNRTSLTSVDRMEVVEDSDTEEDSTIISDSFAEWDNVFMDDERPEQINRKRPRQEDDKSVNSGSSQSSEDDQTILNLQNLALNASEDDVLRILDMDVTDWDLTQMSLAHVDNCKTYGRSFSTSCDAQETSASKSHAKSWIPDDSAPRRQTTVAQLVGSQIASSTLPMIKSTKETEGFREEHIAQNGLDDDMPCRFRFSRGLLSELFPEVIANDLVKYSQIQDAPFESPAGAKVPPKPPPRRLTGSNQPDPNAPAGQTWQVPAPHLRLRRGDGLWDMLPPAMAFWEPLGLAPLSGPKNVMSYCVYPASEGLADSLEGFFDCFRSVYESCKLGAHLPGMSVGDYEDGLVPVAMSNGPPVSIDSAFRALQTACIGLGSLLATVNLADSENMLRETLQAVSDDPSAAISSFVVYMVNPFEEPEALGDVCSCFWSMFQAYEQASRGLSPLDKRPDLVLQVLPIRHVASPDAPIIQKPQVLASLAREIYDRCPLVAYGDSKSLPIAAAPAVQLEEPLPRTIPFKLSADPQGDLLPDAAHLHVGYAISSSGDWLSAAWTDPAGKYQTLVSYCLRGRVLAEVIHEVWHTTMGLLTQRKIGWRVTVAKAGVMERDELEAWISTVTTPSSGPLIPVGTVLASINPSPSLSITPPACSSTQAAGNTTPVSTPQGVSPSDPAAASAATPSDVVQDAANDPDAHLVDISDETWAIIMGHKLNESRNLTDLRPALASGFLVKRGGDNNSDWSSFLEASPANPTAIGVNILWLGSAHRAGSVAPQTPSQAQTPTGSQGGLPLQPTAPFAQAAVQSQANATHQVQAALNAQMRAGGSPAFESFLRDYLHAYRGLGLLAHVRGIRGTKGGLIPWHIAMAMNAVNGLERCM